MTALWDKIVLVLNQTLQVYQALLQLSHRKREILTVANSQELEQLTKQEEMLVIQAGKLEKIRLTIIQELAAGLGLPTSQLILSTLAKHADGPTAVKLIEINKTFSEVTRELAKLNKLNSMLIQQSLDYVSYNINILSQNKADPTYAPQGQNSPGKPGRTILDTKA